MRKSRFTLGSGLALALALAMTAPGAALAMAKELATPKEKPAAEATITAAEREEFRAGVRRAGETMTLLMDAYPDEYAELETKVIRGVKSGQMDLPPFARCRSNGPPTCARG